MVNITIELEAFTGPMDLLCHLIDKNKINIYDIPISQLVDQYMLYLDAMIKKDMDDISAFLVMATTLLQIKSALMLPKTQKDDNSEDIDPREELVKRLLEYKKIKEVTSEFKEREEINSTLLYKDADKVISELKKDNTSTIEDFLHGLKLDDLYLAFREVMMRKDDKVDTIRSSFKGIERDLFTVSQKMVYVREYLYIHNEVYFSKIFRAKSHKMEKVVTFLALLELIKNKEVLVCQDSFFSDILIKKRS